MTGTAAPPDVNPSALAGVRFLVSRRIEELEDTVTALEEQLTLAQRARDAAEIEAARLETGWDSVVRRLPRADPEEVDTAFRRLATARADLAAGAERCSDLLARINGTRAEAEVLRSVHRSFDDLLAASGAPQDGERLRSTSRQVFQVIEEERMRIARDMHDGPAQSMANLVLQAEILERLIARDPQLVVKELHDFKDGVRGVLDDTRRLIFDLRPMTLDDLGLVPTLRKFVREFGERAGWQTSLRVVGEETRLSGSLEPTIFRIVQEALNNARKHAQAQHVDVVITFQPAFVSALVKDDGVGMDVEATQASLDGSRHLGLISMHERAELEKGHLDIRSTPGEGTEVRATFEI